MADKQIVDLVEKLSQQGWKVKHKKHFVVFPPNKKFSPVTIAATPSDHRAFKNIVSRCKARGAKL